ncbi:unnamed protein product [Caenorhabditis auriculariae]|uniref:Uncharacterized protein n=1 Tax=Caenorhabditis auriculariae TaxID=2777116 RepID=A0A8S1H2W0_9PELO|nr:unnamed protein product [Caenorhabditis auriculariae]
MRLLVVLLFLSAVSAKTYPPFSPFDGQDFGYLDDYPIQHKIFFSPIPKPWNDKLIIPINTPSTPAERIPLLPGNPPYPNYGSTGRTPPLQIPINRPPNMPYSWPTGPMRPGGPSGGPNTPFG